MWVINQLLLFTSHLINTLHVDISTQLKVALPQLNLTLQRLCRLAQLVISLALRKICKANLGHFGDRGIVIVSPLKANLKIALSDI
jgi:hypothetical protein